MSHTEYFGVLKNTYAAERRQISVLGALETHPQHGIQVPVNAFRDFIGPTNCVHWYLNNSVDKVDFNRIEEGSPVRIRCDEHWINPDETKDRRRVYFMHVVPSGALILPESLCNGWKAGESAMPFGVPNCSIFIRSADGVNLFGPWRVQERRDEKLIVPVMPPTVYRYSLAEVRDKYALQVYRHPNVENLSVIGASEMPFKGEPVDVATPTQLSNWLKKKLDQVISAQRIKDLDATYPGWKKGLADAVKEATPDEQQRWQRVQGCLDSVLADADAMEAIKQTSDFRDALSRAIATEIERRRDEIEANASRAAREQTKSLEFEIAKLEKRKAEISVATETEERRLERPIQQLASLRESLAGDFERLKAEAAILSSLFVPETGSSNAKSPTDRVSLVLQPTDNADLKEVAPQSFLTSRFHPLLAESMIGISAEDARDALATVVGSRAVLLPDAKWFFAFCKAFNAQGEIGYCDPRWLTWVDAWRDLGGMWQNQPESPYWKFILIHDFNIAIPELWARPLLNVIAGATQALPNNSKWPERVRLFLVPAQGEAALPVSHEVLSHFSAIKLTAQFLTSDSKREFAGFRLCDVRRPLKRSAVKHLQLAGDTLPRVADFSEGIARKVDPTFDRVLPGVMSDVSAMSRILCKMELEEDDAIEIALNMRCRWISTSEKTAWT